MSPKRCEDAFALQSFRGMGQRHLLFRTKFCGVRCVLASLLFTLRLAQLSLGGFHIARRLLAKQDRAEFVSLIVTHSKFFLCVRALNINTRGQHAEIANKIYPQIEDFRPKVGDLLVADAFFAGHIGACDQTLAPRVVPMRLASHAAH